MTDKHVLQVFKLSLPLAKKLQALDSFYIKYGCFFPKKPGHLPLNMFQSLGVYCL